MADYLPTIGLEIHAELKTQTKMFCDSLNDPDEKRPNINVCPICAGHPGTLPVANADAIRKVVQVGLALGCDIERESFFERKNYFYPDLPKGYQISQFQRPFCRNGKMVLSDGSTVRIERIHLEEDAGRLQHADGATLVDLNRAGVPLMELVTEPDISDPEHIRMFATELQLLLRYLDASDADIEKGQMRVEVNLSIRPADTKEFGVKTEVKNIGSISTAVRAAAFEIRRQTEALDAGTELHQETRGWDEDAERTVAQRSKEGSADYRYFPEPDLPPLSFSEDEIEELRSALPELPAQRRERFATEFGLPSDDIEVLTVFKELGDFYELVVSELGSEDDPVTGETGDFGKLAKLAANWLITNLQPKLNASSAVPQDTNLTPERFADFIVRIGAGEVSSSGAQTLLDLMWKTGDSPEHLIREHDLGQVSDASELNVIVETVIAENEKVVADYRGGKEAALKALIGRVMAASKGKANPQVAERMLKEKLSNG